METINNTNMNNVKEVIINNPPERILYPILRMQ